MPVLRPWLDARDPWRFVDNDPESDPTVFVALSFSWPACRSTPPG